MREGRVVAGIFAVLSLALGGFSCDKKSVAKAPDPGPAVPFEAPGKPVPAPARAPDAGAPAAKAKAASPDERFASLAELLPSPCGKSESLRRTLDTDPGCKRAPFAKAFIEKLIRYDVEDEAITQYYTNRFASTEKPTFTLRDTPFVGSSNAPVVIVEFYDYGCPHCREAAPLLEQIVANNPKDVALYFKQYPLRRETTDAARGALAAQRQGKFKELHHKLFENQPRVMREDVLAYAKEIGLDMARFEKDMNDPSITAKIEADRQEGTKAKIDGTPGIYINGRNFKDAMVLEALNDWVEEELAVNR